MAGIARACNVRGELAHKIPLQVTLRFASQRAHSMLMDLIVQDIGATPAFRCLFVGHFPVCHVVRQSYIVRQAAVDESIGLTAKFFAPRPVLGLLPEDLFQG
jgi:hypothetical protein